MKLTEEEILKSCYVCAHHYRSRFRKDPSIDYEDVAHDTYILIKQRGVLEDDSIPEGWARYRLKMCVFEVIKNKTRCSVGVEHRYGWNRGKEAEIAMRDLCNSSKPQTAVELRELFGLALVDIPDKQKELLVERLQYDDNVQFSRDVDTLATQKGIGKNSMVSAIYKGRKRLKENLTELLEA